MKTRLLTPCICEVYRYMHSRGYKEDYESGETKYSRYIRFYKSLKELHKEPLEDMFFTSVVVIDRVTSGIVDHYLKKQSLSLKSWFRNVNTDEPLSEVNLHSESELLNYKVGAITSESIDNYLEDIISIFWDHNKEIERARKWLNGMWIKDIIDSSSIQKEVKIEDKDKAVARICERLRTKGY